MEVLNVFDKLVKELTNEERLRLLERIKESSKQANLSPSYEVPMRSVPGIEEFKSEEESRNLNFLARLFVTIVALIKGLTKEEILKRRYLERIRKAITRHHPGLVDFKRKTLLEPFKEELLNLKSATDYFSEIMKCAFARKREGFIVFTVSNLLQDTYYRIREEIDPDAIAGEVGYGDRSRIKKEMEERLRGIFSDISDAEREKVLNHLLPLYSLYILANSDISLIVAAFERNTASGTGSASFSVLRDKLDKLASKLSDFKTVPDLADLEALFIYCNSELLDDTEADFDGDLGRFLSASRVMLERIMAFKSNIPVVDILRYMMQDPLYVPASGIRFESWFNDFKNFWNRWATLRFRNFSLRMEKEDLLEDIKDFLGNRDMEFIENYSDEIYAYRYTMALINSFYRQVFVPHVKNPLRILHINGDFYKESNRELFTDSFNWFVGMEEKIMDFNLMLAEGGALYEELRKLEKEILPPNLKKKKREIITGKADAEAEKIIEKTLENVSLINRVLEGILYGEVGGEFDTIANFGSIGGKGNKRLVSSWKKILEINDRFMLLLKNTHRWERSYRQSTIDSIALL